MSTALAIAGVTAVLRDLLNDGLVNGNVAGTIGSTVTVSTLPPDRMAEAVETSGLNLFLHQVTPNAAWRNTLLPSRDPVDAGRRSNPPLAVDLHYLLSAHGAEELHGEILLGYAMQLLHETPVLRAEAVRRALDPSPDTGTSLPPALRALADCGLADQIEQVRIQPAALGGEELSRIWSALLTSYRPTAAYVASVVLIEARRPVRAPLPVLRRAIDVRPSVRAATLVLETVAGPGDTPLAPFGDAVALSGAGLGTDPLEAVLLFDRFAVRETIGLAPGATPEQRLLTISDALAATLPVGLYAIWLRAADARTSNRLGLVVRPRIDTLPVAAIARDAGGTATIPVAFTPAARPGQTVSLIVDDRETAAPAFAVATQLLTFVVAGLAAGPHRVRLRIDGIDSEIVDRTAQPPAFLTSAQVEIA